MRLSAMRFILALALCVLVVSPAAHAQPVTKVYRSGYVRTGTAAYTPSWDEAFKQRRQELGYTAGQNLVIEARFANGQGARLPALVEEMVQLQVDCLAVGGTLGTLAAKQATSTIPIVMLNASDDPVRLGLITSLVRPGGNITGVIDIMEQLAGKRLELLQEAFPHIAPVGHLSAQNVSPAVADLQEVEAAARLQGVRVHPLPVQGPEELEQAFQSAREERAEALIVVGAGCPLSHRKRIVQLVDTLRVPVMYKQIPRSPRRNGLPVKLIDRALLMRHEHWASSPVELLEVTETAPRSNRGLHHPPEACDRVEVRAAVGG
jgi:ABC-type uncharacterized transport system substrate-binding protein